MHIMAMQKQRLLLLLALASLGTATQAERWKRSADTPPSPVMNMTTTTTIAPTTTRMTTTAKPDRAAKIFKDVTEKMLRIGMREFYPLISDLIYDPRISPGCMGSLLKIGTALQTLDIWAVQMLDAMGKPPAGLMQGRLSGYGAYDQCLAVRHDEGLFRGKYCMIHLVYNGSELSPSVQRLVGKFVKHLGFEAAGDLSKMNDEQFLDLAPLYKFGVCVPSLCYPEDLQVMIDHFLKGFGIQLKAKWCAMDEPVRLDRRQTVILCIFGVWVSFVLFGTAYDIYKTVAQPGEDIDSAKKTTITGYISKAVEAFSLRRAMKKLIDMPNWDDYSNELGFIHGFRVLSATWVVLGHSYIIRDPHINSDFVGFFKKMRDDFFFTVTINSFMAVETFLVITGFLSGYLVTKAPRVHLSPILVVFFALFRRYVRLVVPMAALLGYLYLMPLMMDGPSLRDYWPFFSTSCDNNWWRIFTMTANYFSKAKDMCLAHFWYIAVDFQLAIFSTIILAVITPRWPKISLWLMAVIAAATCLATGLQTYIHDSIPFAIILSTDIKKELYMQMEIYIKAHTHAAPLFVGIIFGCLAVRRHRLSRRLQAAAWTLATAVALAALLGVRTWTVGRLPERLESAFFAALHRAAWGIGVGWVMYACATGRGGYVTKILAWPVFYPLGRLSFSVFLVHLIVLATNSVLSRELIPLQSFLHAQLYVSAVIMSYAIGAVVYLLVECPVAALDNLVFNRIMPKNVILEVMKAKSTAEQLKAMESLGGKYGKKSLVLPDKCDGTNGASLELPQGNLRPCYFNGACESALKGDEKSLNSSINLAKL